MAVVGRLLHGRIGRHDVIALCAMIRPTSKPQGSPSPGAEGAGEIWTPRSPAVEPRSPVLSILEAFPDSHVRCLT